MKKTALQSVGCICLFGVLAFAVQKAEATTVFQNSTGDLTIRYNPGTSEVGDQVVLAGTERYLTNFSFQYYATGTSVAQAQVRFYANTGPLYGGYASPNATPFYDSGLFNIGNTARNTLVFDLVDFGSPLLLPDTFTWSVQFSSLGAGSAGVDIYNPPTIGSDYNDFWFNNTGTWELRTNNASTTMNFASVFQAQTVPEPSVMLLGLFGSGLSWVFLSRSRRG